MSPPEDDDDDRIPNAERWLIRLRNLIRSGLAPEIAIYVFMAEKNWKMPSHGGGKDQTLGHSDGGVSLSDVEGKRKMWASLMQNAVKTWGHSRSARNATTVMCLAVLASEATTEPPFNASALVKQIDALCFKAWKAGKKDVEAFWLRFGASLVESQFRQKDIAVETPYLFEMNASDMREKIMTDLSAIAPADRLGIFKGLGEVLAGEQSLGRRNLGQLESVKEVLATSEVSLTSKPGNAARTPP